MFLRRAIGMRLNGVLPSCVAFRPSGVLGVLLLCVLVALTGCSSKNITSKGPFVLQEPSKGYPSVPSSSGQKTGTVYLPSDDGRPLTKAEQEAFLSEGEIDRNLPQEELGDVLLHFKYLVHKDRYTVEKNLERAQLYMPFIYETLRSRGLPRELAYVAFIESGYNPMATSGTNYAQSNPDLAKAVKERSERWQKLTGSGAPVPMELLTASASGLDPQISLAGALYEIPWVSRSTGIPAAQLEALVRSMAKKDLLAFGGDPLVNVLELNLKVLDITKKVPFPKPEAK